MMTIGELRMLLSEADDIERELVEQETNKCYPHEARKKRLKEIEDTVITWEGA